ncbi:UNVERIFIED_CONTAM: hypothetical protein FKN15_046711 [Acipenser sinensis]
MADKATRMVFRRSKSYSTDVFICSVLGLTITSTGPSSIEKAGGETINFDCRFTLAPEDTGPLDIEWTLLASDNQNRDQMIILYSGDRVYEEYYAAMKGRVHFNSPDPKTGDASINITKLLVSDTGTYLCKVKKAPGVDSRKTLLTVMVVNAFYPSFLTNLECPIIIFILVHRCNPPATREMEAETRVFRNVFLPIRHFSHCEAIRPVVPEDNTDLSGSTADPQVPLKPSVPKCYVEGSSEQGKDILMKCKSAEGTNPIQYTWERISGTRILPATALLDRVQGSIVIKNATSDNSGTYRCVSENRVGKEQCTLSLSVVPPSNTAGKIAGAVIGSLLALLLLAIILYCCYKNRNKKKYEKETSHEIRVECVYSSCASASNTAGKIAGAVIGSLLALLLLAIILYCCYKNRNKKKYEKETSHEISMPPLRVMAACQLSDEESTEKVLLGT